MYDINPPEFVFYVTKTRNKFVNLCLLFDARKVWLKTINFEYIDSFSFYSFAWNKTYCFLHKKILHIKPL